MLVVDDGFMHGKRTTASSSADRGRRYAELYARSTSNYSRGGEEPLSKNTKTVVRRLTPLECERLQGFPDGWTDLGEWTDSKGKKHKAADSPRYKALGNSLALPFWRWLARRIVAQYEGKVTMGSLFDGVSGFPLVFSECGVKPVWSSEIEEFPTAVAKKHFPEDE
jgi:DNA (cytosine-5)-methyltransferase 1